MKCRLCLSDCELENGILLFNNDEESNLTKLIAKYLYIEVTQHDVFSRILCKDCIQHLNEFHRFFQHVEQQQQVLQKEFFEVNLVLTQRLKESETNIENNEESLLDIKDVINEDETCLNRTMSEKEFGCAEDLLDKQTPHDTESEEDIPLLTLLHIAKNTGKGIEIKPLPFKPKRVERTLKQKCTKRKRQDNKHGDDDLSSKFRGKLCLTSEENKLRDDTVSKYIELKCGICDTCVKTYQELKTHFRIIHKRKAFITCCGTRYLRRFLLLDHIQSHLNPDHFRCEVCKKVLKSRSSLKLHMANMHIDRDKMKHACHLCEKKFPFLSVLNSHMMVHTDELNHICKTCNKGFKTDHMLKVHIQHLHNHMSPFICETCGKEYRFKQSFERHVAGHQGQPNEPTEQCTICGQWLRYNCLRKHMQRHQNQVFKCEICSKICKSKSSLTSHIDYCHKMKQIHSCTLCEKAFKRKSLLREHIAMHTGQKDYNCPHCPREFRSKANMYVHVKKIHNEEWTKAQILRNQGPKSQKKM